MSLSKMPRDAEALIQCPICFMDFDEEGCDPCTAPNCRHIHCVTCTDHERLRSKKFALRQCPTCRRQSSLKLELHPVLHIKDMTRALKLAYKPCNDSETQTEVGTSAARDQGGQATIETQTEPESPTADDQTQAESSTTDSQAVRQPTPPPESAEAAAEPKNVAPKDQKRTFKCDECSKTFNTSTALNRHSRGVHKGEHPFSCQQCDKQFKTGSNLTEHVRSIHMSPTHECVVCGKMFGKESNLTCHMNTHN